MSLTLVWTIAYLYTLAASAFSENRDTTLRDYRVTTYLETLLSFAQTFSSNLNTLSSYPNTLPSPKLKISGGQPELSKTP